MMCRIEKILIKFSNKAQNSNIYKLQLPRSPYVIFPFDITIIPQKEMNEIEMTLHKNSKKKRKI